MTITATGAPPPNPGTAPVPTFPFSMFDAAHLVVDEYGELTNDDAAKMSGIARLGRRGRAGRGLPKTRFRHGERRTPRLRSGFSLTTWGRPISTRP